MSGVEGDSLLKVEVLQPANAFLFRSPDTIHNVLHGEYIVCLTVSCISERHQRWVHLRDRSECQVWRPFLDEDHVTC